MISSEIPGLGHQTAHLDLDKFLCDERGDHCIGNISSSPRLPLWLEEAKERTVVVE